jgi:hypothetical protein
VTTKTGAERATARWSKRPLAWCLLALLASALAGCGASSSLDQMPTGPQPAVTVLLRLRSDEGPQVQLLATGVESSTLEQATSAVARSIFPQGQPGAPQAGDTEVEGGSSVAVPITIPDDELTFTVTREQMDTALGVIDPRPRSLAVWACTDGRRTIQVTTQAPGAVPSDAATGSCKIVGSSIADDRVRWTASVTVGALQPPSLLPVAVATSVVLVLLALGIAFLRGRAASREAARRAVPSEPSVH